MIKLAIDYGTSNTVAVLSAPGRRDRPLLFDGSPQLPSAVFADAGAGPGGLLTGRDALRQGRAESGRVELTPKRCVDFDTVLLGDESVPTVDLIAATLRRVGHEAGRVAGGPCGATVLTCPVTWGPLRREKLALAAQAAGLPAPELVSEPVAAAAYFVDVLGTAVPVGQCVVIYDFGAGTFDASVVRRVADGYVVLATEGLSDTGGLDVDATIAAHVLATLPDSQDSVRGRLDQPDSVADRRARMLLWDDVRAAKELLSRATSTFIHVPLAEIDVPLGREQFEQLAHPILDQTVAATGRAIAAAGVARHEIAGLFLVGGSSRIPLAATLLHRRLGIAATVLDQPEMVVAEGALRMGGERGASVPPVAPAPVARPAPAVPAPAPPVPAPVYRFDAHHQPGRPRPGRGRWVALSASLAVLVLAGVALLSLPVFGRDEPGAQKQPAQTHSADPAQTRGGGPGPADDGGPTRSQAAVDAGDTSDLAFPQELHGTWRGELTLSNNVRSGMIVVMSSGERTGRVEYPELGCVGTLNLTKVDGVRFELSERTTGGCSPASSVVLTYREDRRLDAEVVPEGAVYVGTAVLTGTGN